MDGNYGTLTFAAAGDGPDTGLVWSVSEYWDLKWIPP